MASPLHVIILAAGQGSRMKSSLPKVLHPLAGQPLLQHVVDRARDLNAERIHLVVGHGADQVRAAIAGDDLDWALQAEQLGTGHAVDQALPAVPDDARVLVLYGDVPLLCADTLRQLADSAGPENLAILTVELDDPTGYGRILRDDQGRVQAIVEEKDASQAQRRIREVNTGILAAPARSLKRWLPALSADNAQGEYYLTDIIAMAANEGQRICVAQPQTPEEVQGVNDRVQLADLERAFQRRQARALMAAGVTLADPERLDVRGTLSCARDVQIDVGCVFEGHVSLAENVRIGPYCCLRDVELGPGTVLASHSVLEGVRAAGDNQIGPFARLRPGTELAPGAKVGNFVETKKASIGEGSKVNHLSYIGDTRMGARVNVGAGTITCNYDGANKHLTELGDGVFIGSNSALVAPVRVDDNATIGAGSTITRDVEADQLAVARGRQRNIDGWTRPDQKDS